jgi:hypothetical protein
MERMSGSPAVEPYRFIPLLTQRPFAIVIVAGLISRLFLGRVVSPVLYKMVAKEGDVLQV